jgi:Protein of unknown function (DUF3105)
MAHRQEEKERRKRERLEREQAAEAAAKRKRLLQIAAGAVVAAVVVAGIVLAIAGGGKDGNRTSNAAVAAAAKTAACEYKSFPSEGRGHVNNPRTAADYKTNPPTSGDHNPNPAPDGIYPSGNEPAIENWVHTLEHGRVLLMYKPGAPQESIAALEKLYEENVLDSGNSYHMVLMQNNSKMRFQTAAVAWQHYIGCNDLSPTALEAMRKFRDRFVDQGPEFIP